MNVITPPHPTPPKHERSISVASHVKQHTWTLLHPPTPPHPTPRHHQQNLKIGSGKPPASTEKLDFPTIGVPPWNPYIYQHFVVIICHNDLGAPSFLISRSISGSSPCEAPGASYFASLTEEEEQESSGDQIGGRAVSVSVFGAVGMTSWPLEKISMMCQEVVDIHEKTWLYDVICTFYPRYMYKILYIYIYIHIPESWG